MVASILIAALATATDQTQVAAVPPVDQREAWGRATVRRVVFDAPGLAAPDEARRIFAIREGDVLSRSELRAGVQSLIATGQIEDVVVVVEPFEDGVAVLARADVAPRVSRVRIDGVPRRIRRQLLSHLDLPIGRPVRVAKLEADLDRATQFLRDQGYPEAKIEPDLAFEVDRASVDVTLAVSLGQPAVAEAIRLDGVEMTDSEAWKATGLEPGRRLSVGRLEEARRALTRRLQRKGFWEAEVDPPRLVGSTGQGSDGGRPVLRFPVRPGPAYELVLEGISRSKGLDKEALGFVRGEEPFSEAALDDVTRRVRTYLQRAGRLQASVEARVETLQDRKILRLVVREGPKEAIRSVRFPGISSLPESLLEERVGARKGHPWRWGGEPIDDDTLAADAASVLGTLRENGFAEATVDEPRLVAEGNGVAIEFPGSEGQRLTVGELAVEGVPEGIDPPALTVAVGGPWSAAAEEQSRALLEAAIRNAGYLDATVTSTGACEAGSCRVALTVTPGEPSRVGRVVIAGLARTDARVVKKVAAIEPGQVAGPEALLAAQRRMLGLGIFQRVGVRSIPGQISGAQRGVLIEVDEAQSRAVTVGVGWDNVEQARLSFSWSELNLFGRARSLFVDTKVSGREKHFQVSYREPARLGVLGFPTWVSVFRTEEHYTDYDLLRRGTWVEFGDRKRRPGRLLLRYDYQITLPDAPDEILSELERDKQQAKIASVTPILEWDSRDDALHPDPRDLCHGGAAGGVRALPRRFAVRQGDRVGGRLHPLGPGRAGGLAADRRDPPAEPVHRAVPCRQPALAPRDPLLRRRSRDPSRLRHRRARRRRDLRRAGAHDRRRQPVDRQPRVALSDLLRGRRQRLRRRRQRLAGLDRRPPGRHALGCRTRAEGRHAGGTVPGGVWLEARSAAGGIVRRAVRLFR